MTVTDQINETLNKMIYVNQELTRPYLQPWEVKEYKEVQKACLNELTDLITSQAAGLHSFNPGTLTRLKSREQK